MFFFFALEPPLDEALDRPEELEEDFCAFAMARMLAEALPHVNRRASSATSEARAVFDSLNRTAARLENNLLENGSSPRHWYKSFQKQEHGRVLACPAGVCYKFEM